jgi:hypothetical protein
MKKVFLVMLEDGTCAFSRVPGDANGMRRTPAFKRKASDSKNDAPQAHCGSIAPQNNLDANEESI